MIKPSMHDSIIMGVGPNAPKLRVGEVQKFNFNGDNIGPFWINEEKLI